MTGGLLALNQFSDEKLRAHAELVPNMVSEIIRWQTPLPHMRRTVTEDVEYGGRRFHARDKAVRWYLSANRDEDVFPHGDNVRIGRRRGARLRVGDPLLPGAHLAGL